MQGGKIQVRSEEDTPIVAYEWIQQIKMDTGFRKTIIEKVTWNEENDITEIVKQLMPIVVDDLPF
ncbi:hypothetical protein B1NLA3E_01350 [Bacillus sp. 1NLA3E]|nr:hypothetical protein B1NLA3E_01350 [Bacillus sp. 1NLA3E]